MENKIDWDYIKSLEDAKEYQVGHRKDWALTDCQKELLQAYKDLAILQNLPWLEIDRINRLFDRH